MLCCRESIKGILVKPGEDEQTFCRIMHQYLCMQRVYILYEQASIVDGEKSNCSLVIGCFSPRSDNIPELGASSFFLRKHGSCKAEIETRTN